MTAPATRATLPGQGSSRAAAGAGAATVAALGCAFLAARPALIAATHEPARALVVLFVALLATGIAVPLPGHITAVPPSPRTFVVALIVGVGAFAAGRILIGGHAPSRFTLYALAVNVLAAVAEEVWFRRLCYGLVEPAGTAFAIGASSLLFAAVHVSIYGWAILPLDLAAGAVLGWQRAVTGSWHAPAFTHALANVFVLL